LGFWRIKLKKFMKENVIKDRSFDLAVEIVFIYQYLTREKREYVLNFATGCQLPIKRPVKPNSGLNFFVQPDTLHTKKPLLQQKNAMK